MTSSPEGSCTSAAIARGCAMRGYRVAAATSMRVNRQRKHPGSLRHIVPLVFPALLAMFCLSTAAKSYTVPPEVSRALQSLTNIAPGDCPNDSALDAAVGPINGFLDQNGEALKDLVHSSPDAMLWHAAAVWRQGDLARAEREMAAWLAGAPAEHESRATAESDLDLIREEQELWALKVERPQVHLQLASLWQEKPKAD